MKFRDRAGDGPEPDDGLEARLTADAESWLAETSPSFTESPSLLVPAASASSALVGDTSDVFAGRDDEVRDELTTTAPTRGVGSRRAPLLVAAAVIALVAAVAIPLWANRSESAAPAPAPATGPATTSAPAVPVATPQCGSKDGLRPADQGSIAPAAGSLVPAESPISMLICEYPLPIAPDGPPEMGVPIDYDYQALRSSRTIRTGLSSVPNDLSRFPALENQSCVTSSTEGAPPPQGSDFRIALQYPSGVIWISDSTGPTVCAIATGSGGVSASYADLFLRSLRSGSWEPSGRQAVPCPSDIDATPFEGKLAVPKPSIGTGDRLVPTDSPAAVVLCGYSSQQSHYEMAGFDAPFRSLEREVELQGDFSALVAELRAFGAVDLTHMECPVTESDRGAQMIGLTYGTGPSRTTVWVETGQGMPCGGSTNGSLSTLGRISESSTDALNGTLWAGLRAIELDPNGLGTPLPSSTYPAPPASEQSDPVWTEDAPPSTSVADQACLDFSGGPGLGRTMIPAGYSSVEACFHGPVDLPAGLVDKINTLSDPVDASKCFNGDTYQDADETPSLVFLYPDRSPVVVYFYDNCAPLIGNGDHEVAAPKAILDQLLKLAGY